MSGAGGHLACPFCGEYEVNRLYLGSLNLDACACSACGAHWDERRGSGVYASRGSTTTVFTRRRRR